MGSEKYGHLDIYAQGEIEDARATAKRHAAEAKF